MMIKMLILYYEELIIIIKVWVILFRLYICKFIYSNLFKDMFIVNILYLVN